MRILIIGGGVAGICLARQFHKFGAELTVIDSGKNFSTRIAAGMINPMTFRKMVKTWEGDVLLPYLVEFYRQLEADTSTQFFFERKIRRVFSTAHEKQLWIERQTDPSYEGYIFEWENNTPDFVKHEWGSGVVNAPGYLDSPLFLDASHRWMNENIQLRYEEFDFDQLDAATASYQGECFDGIIFAEGYRGKENPYFGYLPLQQTKGEVLTVEIDGLKRDEIINRKCFVLPTHDGKAKLGATFAWNTTDTSPTEEGKSELLGQYQDLLNLPIQVVDHEAGIRPTVTDRRPLLGRHPEYSKLLIFNGMGTKGYMLAPYYSEVLLRHVTEEEELPAEVDIHRFKKHFNK
jgi:glycine/D-amino acid oxidase-like deaminating enzyme